jgi:plastocyanin
MSLRPKMAQADATVKASLLVSLSIGLLIAACGDEASAPPLDLDAGDGTASSDGADGSGEPCSFTIRLLDYKLEPADVEAASGVITVCAINDGRAPHDLAVRDANRDTLGRTKVLGQGESDRFDVELDSGVFDIICAQAGHESLGMRGTLALD